MGAVLTLGGLLWFGLRLRAPWIGIIAGAGGLLLWLLAWLQSRR